MKTSAAVKKNRKRRITFSLESDTAKSVHLVGEFNDWKVGAHAMTNKGEGVWVKSVLLPEGQFEYKFIVDEQWVADPLNERCCPNCFGTRNSIVHVTT